MHCGHEDAVSLDRRSTCYRRTLWVLGLMVVIHLALPVLLAHTGHIAVPAMAMSIIGGVLIYGTIISFTLFFQEEQDF